MHRTPLFNKIDCVQIPVPSLDSALAFYCENLGHELIWRQERSAGLRMPGTDAEIVLQLDCEQPEVNLLVDAVDEAAREFEAAGGKILVPPFDIQIGRCVVVGDPWDNALVLLDMSKGRLLTDEQGNVIGLVPVGKPED